ncbi:MAG TPA: hypothetical protein VFB58_01205 [Chloroflexota bacterium]|nr:hypothetical protein [Chloroflexota bacterium]
MRRWVMALLIIAAPVLACGVGVGLVADGYSLNCKNIDRGIEIQVTNWTASTELSIPIPAGQCPS